MIPTRLHTRPASPCTCGVRRFGVRSAVTIGLGVYVSLAALTAEAGDILRGGTSVGAKPGAAPKVTVSPAQEQATASAREALARTSQSLKAVQAMQAAARNVAARGPANLGFNPKLPGQRMPNVPNGLRIGGLQVAPGVPRNLASPTAAEDSGLWQGALLPRESLKDGKTNVVITQTKRQAVLNWETFNIGKETKLTFDQEAGGTNKSQWTAFNKVNDPSGVPSQILGSIEAPGQVYLINRNGVIFGGSSQINTRAFVASTLPINDNLVRQGLLNNRDAQFLFSGLPVPGGSDGTPAFNPTISDSAFTLSAVAPIYTLGETVALDAAGAPVRAPEFTYRAANGAKTKLVAGTDYTVAVDAVAKTATATFTAAGLAKAGTAEVTPTYTPTLVKSGDIVVQPGARMSSPANGGNGGRVMLVAPNVTNAGTISTPAGQTILAAGNQVGVAAHASSDPSLRGLDVYVGAVAPGAGRATNRGVIEAFTGSVSISGREVHQLGAIESSTSVDLNGRIDLNASFGAVGNPSFDAGSGAPPFLFQRTGLVEFGPGSVTRILPDYESDRTIPGLSLSQRSQINATGLAVHFGGESQVLAPNADVRIRAGVWPYRDTDGNRTTLNAAGEPEGGLTSYFTGTSQRFLFSGGQIYFDPTASLNVAGSADVFVPLAQSILGVELRGSELADSPLQRGGLLRAVPLTVDLRRTGVVDGRFWIGTPLGDLAGLAGIIERNAAQLTTAGGNVTLQAGGSIVLREDANIDVSGGFLRHAAGMVQTTRVLQDGRLVNISDALPDQIYDGVYTGKFTTTSAKWGVTETYTTPFMLGARWEESFVEGARGGVLTMTAPSMALDGQMVGHTVEGPRQRSAAPEKSRLAITFSADGVYELDLPDLRVIPFSPTPLTVVLASAENVETPAPFTFGETGFAELPDDRKRRVTLSPELFTEQGFGHLAVENADGEILVPAGVHVAAPALGSISLAGSNVTVQGRVSAPGGSLSFRAFNLSPSFVQEFSILQASIELDPKPNADRGLFTLGPGASLDTAGLIVDDRAGARGFLSEPMVLAGGSISIRAFSADLAAGSTIDVSGGVNVSARGRMTPGNGGSIEILTGKDLSLASVIGGSLQLGSELRGYSGATGGSLAVQASLIHIGGGVAHPNALVLLPEFFQQGGFTQYALTGIGAASGEVTAPGEPAAYAPAIFVAPGTVIEPRAESFLALPTAAGAKEATLVPIEKEVGQRSPVSLSLTAIGADDNVTLDVLEARGDIVLGAGSRIRTDPGASIALDADAITLLGSLIAPGGTISIKGEDTFALPPLVESATVVALPTVHLGRDAIVSTAGTTVFQPDAFGRRIGTVYAGGTITMFGNIVAEAGSLLDVSGTASTLDFHPSRLGIPGASIVPANSGVGSPLWRLASLPVSMDSSGGLIELEGAQMLLSDATLRGAAGGPTALGGTLSVHSGRFYSRTNGAISGAVRSSDINLVVTQGGTVLPGGAVGIGRETGVPGMGYFALDRFTAGGFQSLDLGAKFLETPQNSPVATGGNIEFRGPISLRVPGVLRLAGGGVVQADSAVNLSANYLVLGQPFRAPLQPNDPIVVFQEQAGGAIQNFGFAPTAGPGRLVLTADLLDVGHLSLQGIGVAGMRSSGDLRGFGTVAIRGDLTLEAAQIYPTTLADFNVFAYDPAGGTGSVTILGGDAVAPPLSAGGNLSIFASNITQAGVLRAPIGSIQLGWDGTDFDPSDADLDVPFDPVTRGTVPVLASGKVTLAAGSLTSVSARDLAAGTELLLPFGISPDGNSWIDPRGVNVTATGLPEKIVSIAGNRVRTQVGSVIDIGGGGDFYGFRFLPGIGGSTDILGTATTEWTATAAYEAGDLVQFRGDTYAARVGSTGERPTPGLFWTRLAESFAVLPGFGSEAASLNVFNPDAALLQGTAGYLFTPSLRGDRVSTSLGNTSRLHRALDVGDQISLDAAGGLEAGTYTLLPRRYALYPGAFLITPQAAEPLGTIDLPTGAALAQGRTSNAFARTAASTPIVTRFEIASEQVTRSRASFQDLSGNRFFAAAAEGLEIARPQRLPIDAGYAAFHGNTGFSLNGDVATTFASNGRGALIDISSFADIHLTGGAGSAPAGATAILDAARLNSWGAESVLVGGLRRRTGAATTVDVRTTNLFLNNRGQGLFGSDITLVADAGLTIAPGSALFGIGRVTEAPDAFLLGADGVAIRVSAAASAVVSRPGLPSATTPLLTIGAGVRIGGSGVVIDSTYGTQIDPSVRIDAQALTLGSGQISIVLAEPVGGLTGSVVDPHLVLTGDLLEEAQGASRLTLKSYRTIDIYGAGDFGSPTLASLRLLAAGMRGFDQGAGSATFTAGSVLFANPSGVAALPAPAGLAGGLEFEAGRVLLGSNSFSIAGYQDVTLNARSGLLGRAPRLSPGVFTTLGDLTIRTPLITGLRGTTHAITAAGDLQLLDAAGRASVRGGLGSSFTFTGASVLAETDIVLPSGEIVLRARAGDVTVGGKLDASGVEQRFFDLVRFSNAGRVLLTSDQGDIRLADGSVISVSAAGLGRAGTVGISAASGTFINDGMLLGDAASDGDSGTFLLDVRSAGDYASISDPLQVGGFFKERNLRIRTGAITIGGTTRTLDFTLSADAGPITVTGTIDASGVTGGKIALISGGSLTLANGAVLTAHAETFSSAGKGGNIRLEAGAAINGVANTSALLDLQAGSTIDLGVDAFVAGAYTDPASSAFRGRFQGTLHLRAPRAGNDIRIATLAGDITGASAILAEGFRVYDRTGFGTLDTGLLATIHADSTSYINAGGAAMSAKLLAANPSLADALVLAPGVEIINRTGNLVLGTDFDDASQDWNLAALRYGPRNAPSVLTLRAQGNLEFKNALSDGFAGDFSPNDFGETPPPGQQLWLRPLMDIVSTLPVNLQSWSYRLNAGADFAAADFHRLRPLDTLAAGTGSVLVGKFYPADLYSPNGLTPGPDATTAQAINNRFQVIRTGAGSIDIAAGRDVQLRNQFSTIYTAGVRLPYSNTIFAESDVRLMSIFSPNDFAVPVVELTNSHPTQGQLGAIQQAYAAQYAMAGGDVDVTAQQDIGRFTLFNGQVRVDSSRQLPNNWLYRRGLIDNDTGLFGNGGVSTVNDGAASTTWWVDYSNFFQGLGALGGGDVSLAAGRHVVNADAVAPTNARMPGRDAAGTAIAPDASRLVELGGGDVSVVAGGNIDGGTFYVQRGEGTLAAGGAITTNAARSPSPGILAPASVSASLIQSVFPAVFDSRTWLPTTLFVGDAHFDVSSAGDILLGPVTNSFLLPQGLNNKYWYKTYFNTYSEDAGATVASFGGSVTHRLAVTLPGDVRSTPVLQAWLANQNANSASNSSFYEPWIRLAEADVSNFSTVATINAPNLRSTAFGGDINLVGDLNLFPSAQGTIELAASGSLIGLQPTGRTRVVVSDQSRIVTAWTPASINLSDADPNALPGISSPLAYAAFVPRTEVALSDSRTSAFPDVNRAFLETGSYTGVAASIETQSALHGDRLLHAGDTNPVRIYALGGDISALTVFSPKAAQIVADNDISDVAFYLQNTAAESISFVSAGRDIIAFNENDRTRTGAGDIALGNSIVGSAILRTTSTVLGTSTLALAGDIQVSGPGVLEVLAGRNLDLGTGANFEDNTGLGLTSIGNFRNPNLPTAGASIIALAGVGGRDGDGPAFGLSESALSFDGLFAGTGTTLADAMSPYLASLDGAAALSDEQKAIVGLENFFAALRGAGRAAVLDPGDAAYEPGFAAIASVFGAGETEGEIFTRARDIRTAADGTLILAAPGGGLTLASEIFGNPLTPPGIVTEAGGAVSIFTRDSVDIGQARIFTLRGGDLLIWSSEGDIAAGTAPKTVVTAPPTRVIIDATSGDVKTDLGGLATGGGIGVLAAVEGVPPGNVDLIAPGGVVDAGDAGIRSTGNLSIAATAVVNASNISVGGSSTGVPSAPSVSAPSLGSVGASNSAAGAQSAAANSALPKDRDQTPADALPSIVTVEVIGYGGGDATGAEEDDDEKKKRRALDQASLTPAP